MYSVVMAAMLAAGTTSPDFGHHRYSCNGCWGSSYSCYGCYGSCYGCSGCYGHAYYGHSCYGSCHGGCHGCHGGWYPGYMMHQIFHHHSCYGCYGCHGCCGGVVYSSCHGCHGCCGGVIVSPPMIVPVPTVPQKTVIEVPHVAPQVHSQPMSVGAHPVAQGATAANTARVTVHLPETARLWVDNVECPLTSGVRSFTTPALNPNQQYFYNLKVELAGTRGTTTESYRVLLTPGRETRVDFNTPNNNLRTVSR